VRTKAIKAQSLHGQAGTGFIKWNRLNSSLLASTHNREVRIWDLRKTATPVVTITGHTADVSDVDWAYYNESRLLTASHDNTIKIWDIYEPRTEKEKISTGRPVAAAQFTPFGEGVLSVGRGERCMQLWSLYDHLIPIYSFQGPTETIESFEWSIKESTKTNNQTYGLVSLAKDFTLNVWSVPKSIQDLCKFPSASRNQAGVRLTQAQSRTRSEDGRRATSDGTGEDDNDGDEGKSIRRRASHSSSDSSTNLLGETEVLSPSSPSSIVMPSPPLNQYGGNLDLKHELSMITQKMRGVGDVVIEANPINRCCTVTLYDLPVTAPSSLSPNRQLSPRASNKSNPRENSDAESGSTSAPSSRESSTAEVEEAKVEPKVLIRILITFPSFYPHAQPSFTYLPGTTIDQERQIFLKRTLVHMATFYSTRGYPCLQKLVMKLINLQRSLDAEVKLEQLQKQLLLDQQAEAEVQGKTGDADEPSSDKSKEVIPEIVTVEEPVKEEPPTKEEKGTEVEPTPGALNAPPRRQRSPSLTIWNKFWAMVGPEDQENAADQPPTKTDADASTATKHVDDSATPKAPEEAPQEQKEVTTEEKPKTMWIPAKTKNALFGTSKAEPGHWRAKVDDHARQVAVTPFVGSFRVPAPLAVALPSETGARLPPSASAALVRAQSFEMMIGSLDVEMTHTSNLLSQSDFQKLVVNLPPRFQFRDWELLYSTMEHGISLHTFYRRVKSHSPTVIIIEDSKKYVFGAFVTGTWDALGKHTGTGESFLFTLSPYFKVFPWTRENQLFMCGEAHSMSIGGGSHVGLWLDEDFEFGTSYPCETFGNECLASGRDFDCVVLEAWGL
jgi:hypothetical protein